MNNQQQEGEDLSHEITRKRKNIHHEQEDDSLLNLSLTLSVRPSSRPRLSVPDEELQQPITVRHAVPAPPPPSLYIPHVTVSEIPDPTPPAPPPRPPSRPRRTNSTQTTVTGGESKKDTVPALFPWATARRATVHSLSYLLSKQITTITGKVQCKKCERQYDVGFNLQDKFYEVGRFVAENKGSMHQRAPGAWMNPTLPACKFCDQENSAKPMIADKKKQINWLFLLLGQMLGCCTLDQLKYFCKHTKNHRTGAKDRVLYLTYLSLCKQLDPNGPFDR